MQKNPEMSLLPLALSMTSRHYKLGSPLLLQGTIPEELMLITRGECQIVRLRPQKVYSRRKEWAATTEKEFFAPPVMLSDLRVEKPEPASKLLGLPTKVSSPKKGGKQLSKAAQLAEQQQQEEWIQQNQRELINQGQFDIIGNIGVGEPLGLRALLTGKYKFCNQQVEKAVYTIIPITANLDCFAIDSKLFYSVPDRLKVSRCMI